MLQNYMLGDCIIKDDKEAVIIAIYGDGSIVIKYLDFSSVEKVSPSHFNDTFLINSSIIE